MEVHQRPGISVRFPGVDELPTEAQTVLDVCAASAPSPPLGRQRPLGLRLVTAAPGEVPVTTGLRHGEGDGGRTDGEIEGHFSAL